MCFKIAQEISVKYTIIKEFGNAALLALVGNPGNNAVIFPDEETQHCDTQKEVFYYEKHNLQFVYGIKLQLEPGYEQEIRGRRNLKAKRGFSICVKLLRQTPEQKDLGIYPVTLESMTI